MKSFQSFFLCALFILVSSCSHLTSHLTSKEKKEITNPREYQLGAYLWYQHSGEFKALCYQAYNLAKMRLDADLANKHNFKRAVIFDIDETVFDNSAQGAYEIKNQLLWNKDSLNKWIVLQKAQAIAGAREFIEYALSKKVEVFFISNRLQTQIDDTFINFNKLQIPVKKENFLFSEGSWSKESRRKELAHKFHIVLFIGDNLGDFHSDWDNKKSDERRALVDTHRADFGDKFIILPNPLYGDWESSLPKNVKRIELLKE